MVRAHEWDVSRRLVRSSAGRPWWTERADPAPALDVEVHSGGGRTVLVVRGDVDTATAPQLERTLLTVPLAGTHALEVELAEVTLLGSVGLSVLLLAHRRCEQAGVDLVLCHVRDSVWRAFEVAGLDRVFVTHPPRGARPAPQELALF